MTLPAAGWFPDPQDAQRLRWWDGRTWGSATQPAPRSTSSTEAASMSRAAVVPQFSVATSLVGAGAGAVVGSGVGARVGARVGSGASVDGVMTSRVGYAVGTRSVDNRRVCVFGWSSIAVALVSAVVNPLGMLSLLAVALAIPGFLRPRATGAWRIVGRSLSASAVVIAITTGLVFADGFAKLLHAYAGI